MRSWLATLLRNLLGDSVGRVLSGGGLALATGALMIPLLTTALSAVSSAFGGITGDILDVALMFGTGEGLSIIGSAMLTRVTINSAAVGLRKAAT